ncbi:hypothetical protein SAMN00777080_4965 [Aquiflexum balticum DSM 16537]|uniref:Uncharacterized protein n=1 Tax=Aquiflexum balticum DSM 16537 TaxID=758820 RepID=A0A1W2HBN6_9BACT|nr:hypothetical protein SAMN00777080_4965 [Aquiflexum balticum DSM 16537]
MKNDFMSLVRQERSDPRLDVITLSVNANFHYYQ